MKQTNFRNVTKILEKIGEIDVFLHGRKWRLLLLHIINERLFK